MWPDDLLIDQPYKDSKRKGLVFVHIIIIAYMFLGLNTVCDLYFTGSLDEMVNKWNVKPDVAGATFMAAGGSAPELCTSLIGAVISESDVGFGTIVGSAVFNVLFVIGLCGFAAKTPIKLTWWPLARDCSYYIFGLSVLAIFAKTGDAGDSGGGEIEIWEALLLFLLYLGYCMMMFKNETIEARVLKGKEPPPPPAEMTPVTPVAVNHAVSGPIADTGSTMDKHHIKKSQPHFERRSGNHQGHAERTTSGQLIRLQSKETTCKTDEENDKVSAPSTGGSTNAEDSAGEEDLQTDEVEEDEEEEEEDDIEELLMRPEETGPFILWCLSLPIYVMLYYGIPKPDEKKFLRTFFVSLIYIMGLNVVLVYCTTILGHVFDIDEIVMGFTVLAAGTSIPDLVSSMAVARAGEGDMAVSSSIGSNIFDILVGLPIPWMIKIGFVEMLVNGNTDYQVRISSPYIVFYVLVLIFMIFCVVGCIHLLGWHLNRTLGVGMAFLYAVFLLIVVIVEYGKPSAFKI
jgi:K+-dependent Na+/Ca+ exchanger-like protein